MSSKSLAPSAGPAAVRNGGQPTATSSQKSGDFATVERSSRDGPPTSMVPHQRKMSRVCRFLICSAPILRKKDAERYGLRTAQGRPQPRAGLFVCLAVPPKEQLSLTGEAVPRRLDDGARKPRPASGRGQGTISPSPARPELRLPALRCFSNDFMDCPLRNRQKISCAARNVGSAFLDLQEGDRQECPSYRMSTLFSDAP